MANPDLLRWAMADLDADRQRLIPVSRQKSFELALQDAETRLHDPALLKHAQRRLVSRQSRKSLELALQDAETRLQDPALLKQVQRRLARLGGAAPKTDALQRLILEVVAGRPGIGLRELVQHLRSLQGQGGVVDDMDDQNISFMNRGRCKDAPISGLKDRLSRAKKALRSR